MFVIFFLLGFRPCSLYWSIILCCWRPAIFPQLKQFRTSPQSFSRPLSTIQPPSWIHSSTFSFTVLSHRLPLNHRRFIYEVPCRKLWHIIVVSTILRCQGR